MGPRGREQFFWRSRSCRLLCSLTDVNTRRLWLNHCIRGTLGESRAQWHDSTACFALNVPSVQYAGSLFSCTGNVCASIWPAGFLWTLHAHSRPPSREVPCISRGTGNVTGRQVRSRLLLRHPATTASPLGHPARRSALPERDSSLLPGQGPCGSGARLPRQGQGRS